MRPGSLGQAVGREICKRHLPLAPFAGDMIDLLDFSFFRWMFMSEY